MTHLVLARVVEDRAELDGYRRVVPGADITVCRLVADEAVRTARLLRRMPPGPSREWHLARTVELEDALRTSAVEDVTVVNGEQPVREVALTVLRRVGWMPDGVDRQPPGCAS